MQPLSALLPASAQGTTVRLLHASDLQQFHDYRSDVELAMYQGWSPIDLVAADNFIKEMAFVAALIPGDWIQLGIADSESNVLIGDVGLYLEQNESAAEIGFTVCRAAQGHGHATRAVGTCLALIFLTTRVEHVRAVTDARNVNSIRVLERANFVRYATQQSVFKGEECTEFVYVHRRADA
jgi:RimJ/RimL family protein N-acetyltransferase